MIIGKKLPQRKQRNEVSMEVRELESSSQKANKGKKVFQVMDAPTVFPAPWSHRTGFFGCGNKVGFDPYLHCPYSFFRRQAYASRFEVPIPQELLQSQQIITDVQWCTFIENIRWILQNSYVSPIGFGSFFVPALARCSHYLPECVGLQLPCMQAWNRVKEYIDECNHALQPHNITILILDHELYTPCAIEVIVRNSAKETKVPIVENPQQTVDPVFEISDALKEKCQNMQTPLVKEVARTIREGKIAYGSGHFKAGPIRTRMLCCCFCGINWLRLKTGKRASGLCTLCCIPCNCIDFLRVAEVVNAGNSVRNEAILLATQNDQTTINVVVE